MTLEEMLALLPDNNTGAIDAADLREIVTGLAEAISFVEGRVTVLEQADPDVDKFNVTGTWQINSNAGSVPGGAQVSSDTGLFGTATWLRFAKLDKANRDASQVLQIATMIYAQQANNASNWLKWDVSGTPTVSGSYVQVPVHNLKGAGIPGSAAWQDAMFVIEAVSS